MLLKNSVKDGDVTVDFWIMIPYENKNCLARDKKKRWNQLIAIGEDDQRRGETAPVKFAAIRRSEVATSPCRSPLVSPCLLLIDNEHEIKDKDLKLKITAKYNQL